MVQIRLWVESGALRSDRKLIFGKLDILSSFFLSAVLPRQKPCSKGFFSGSLESNASRLVISGKEGSAKSDFEECDSVFLSFRALFSFVKISVRKGFLRALQDRTLSSRLSPERSALRNPFPENAVPSFSPSERCSPSSELLCERVSSPLSGIGRP